MSSWNFASASMVTDGSGFGLALLVVMVLVPGWPSWGCDWFWRFWLGAQGDLGSYSYEVVNHSNISLGRMRGRCVSSWDGLSIFLRITEVGEDGGVGLEGGTGCYVGRLHGLVLEGFENHFGGMDPDS